MFHTKEEICKQVSKNLLERFRLAFTAKCHKGKLFDNIAFFGDTDCARQTLEGTYTYPPDTDPATCLLLEEAAITFAKLSHEEVSTYVTIDDFQHYWQRVNERGHYKAASFDYHLLALHAGNFSACAK